MAAIVTLLLWWNMCIDEKIKRIKELLEDDYHRKELLNSDLCPLAVASRRDATGKLIRLILDVGVDVYSFDLIHETALMNCIDGSILAIDNSFDNFIYVVSLVNIRTLIHYGADPCCRKNSGSRDAALHMFRKPIIAKILLEAGGDVMQKNEFGKTPLRILCGNIRYNYLEYTMCLDMFIEAI